MIPYTTLISTSELAAHLEDPDWAVLDCRFLLTEPQKGEQNYLEAHIPGATYAHLERDLSNPVIPGVTGRHPWLSVEQASELFSRMGIDSRMQVVSYDDAGGALAAGRAWWMLRWLGHEAAAVLDGGWQKWVEESRTVKSGHEERTPRRFIPRPRPELLAKSDEIEALRLDPGFRLLDVRAAERFHGYNETIDRVAGHIPGAISAPYMENLNSEGIFRPAEELRQRYKRLLGETPAHQTVFYCGSGVTGIHGVLAMMHAGLGEARLYAGSWSEWIADGKRPVETDT